jgi:hypothetical protein
LPGETAQFANYTSYTRGLNGVMIDVANLPVTTLDAGDFIFRAGNTADPATWPLAVLPSSITVRPAEGIAGSDRITLTWPDGALQNQWLQVTVLSTGSVGLAADDVFYFGNTPGDAGVGNLANAALVNFADRAAVRANPHTLTDPAAIDSPHDFNRDRLVNAADRAVVQTNPTGPLTGLLLFTAPGGPAPIPAVDPLASTSTKITRATITPRIGQAAMTTRRVGATLAHRQSATTAARATAFDELALSTRRLRHRLALETALEELVDRPI